MRFRRVLPTACLVAILPLAGCSDSNNDESRADTSTTVSPLPTVRPVDTSFTGEGSAEFCQFITTFTSGSQNVGANATPAQLEASFTEALTAINQAVAVAPAEIKPDVESLASTFQQVVSSVSAAGYDVTQLNPSAVAPLQSEPFLQSVTRVQAYLNNVCNAGG